MLLSMQNTYLTYSRKEDLGKLLGAIGVELPARLLINLRLKGLNLFGVFLREPRKAQSGSTRARSRSGKFVKTASTPRSSIRRISLISFTV